MGEGSTARTAREMGEPVLAAEHTGSQHPRNIFGDIVLLDAACLLQKVHCFPLEVSRWVGERVMHALLLQSSVPSVMRSFFFFFLWDGAILFSCVKQTL